MLEITSHRNGEILNCHYGQETSEALEIKLEGIADPQSLVTVNGLPVFRRDRYFSAPVQLTEKINLLTVAAHNKFGDFQQRITLVWDKQSFKRYAMRIDDNVFFLDEIARERPKSLMQHFYLKNLQKLHDEFGTKFILKCFYRNDHHPFEMKKFPEQYREEFRANSDWLKLSFHAYSEFPDRPYQHATAARLAADYDLVKAEICRFAGEESFLAPTNVHWAMLPPDLFSVLRERGTKVLTSGGFLSNRIIVEGEIVEVGGATCDIGFFYEQDVARHMQTRRCFYDPDHELFLSRTFFCCNIDTQEEIISKIQAEEARDNTSDIMEAVSHEQYAFPNYPQFLPDYFERLRAACQTLTELGYQPVFFSQGVFGNTAWDK
ncbi:MAG: hypothetical protein WCT05_01580 [Lentisphaeria bacterium]